MEENESGNVSSALQVLTSEGLPVKYALTETALILPDGVEYEVVEKMYKAMKVVSSSMQWWIGALINYAERNYGEKYSQMLDESDYSYGALRDMAWVEAAIAPRTRRKELTFNHHKAVAKMGMNEQGEFLDMAVKEKLSFRALTRLIQEGKESKEGVRPPKLETYELALQAILKTASASCLCVKTACDSKDMAGLDENQKAVTMIAITSSNALDMYKGK